MLYFIILILFICICSFIYVKLNKNNIKQKENFKSRITMDDVLDNYCAKTVPLSMDNYEGPWLNDTYVGPARCGRYECPTEVCSTIQPEFGYFGNPHAFFYSDSTDKMAWESNLDPTVAGNCVTKHNPDSNIFCKPHGDPPQCPKHMFDKRVYRFNSNVNQWETRYVNYLMNSNGDCKFRDVNQPFDIVQLRDTNFNYVEGDNTSSNIYYTNIGSTCTLRFDSAENYYYGDGNTISMNDYERYNERTKEFICKNGSRRQYGYTNSPGTPSGFSCGLSGSNCGTCENEKKQPCYIFNSNDRSFDKINFLQTYFNHDGNDATNEVCDTYVVRPDENIAFEQLNDGRYYLDESHLNDSVKDDLLIHDPNNTIDNGNTIITKDQFDITHSNICKIDVVPDQCDTSETTCRIIGSELEPSVLAYFNTPSPGSFTPDATLYPIENKLINVKYRRRWNSNGTNCEYCVVRDDSQGSIIEDSCKASLSCDNTVTCPKGTTLSTRGLSTYCTFCGPDEYYDETSSNCEKLRGCDEGYFFNPFDNVNSDFKIYNQKTKTNIIDNAYGVANRVTPNTYKHYNHTFLDNNTPSQCTACGPNTFMKDYEHVNLECDTCDPVDSQYGIFQTVVNNSCKLCGTTRPNIEDNSPNPKYITFSNNIRYCKTCPTLDDPQYSGQKVIALTSDVDGVDGQCYRECLPNRSGFNNVRINDDSSKKPWTLDDRNIGKYEKCDIECPDHHSIDNTTKSCEPCPIGQEGNYQGGCTPCVSGFYNDVPGSACKPCPNTNESRHKLGNTKLSPTGSTSVTACQSACSAPYSSCNVPFTGSLASGSYNFAECPSTPCSTGLYDRERIPNSRNGYRIDEVMGTRNDSVGGFCDPGSTPYDNGQTEECKINETTTEGFTVEPFTTTIVEPFGTTYCCPQHMEFDINNDKCECKSAQYFRDQLPESKRKHTGTTVTYESGECKLDCAGTASRNTSGYCEMSCENDQYVDGSSCTPCPVARNAETMIARVYNRDPRLEDCKIATCSNNFSLIGDTCVENKRNHEYYKQNYIHWATTFAGSYQGINKDAGFITVSPDIELPTYHTKQSESLTQTEINEKTDSVLKNCHNSSSAEDIGNFNFGHTSVFKVGDTVICCNDENKVLSSVGVNGKNRSVCCPSNQEAKLAHDSTNRPFIGCCPPSQKLYVNSAGQTGCCPASETTDGGKTYFLNEDGTSCDFTCIGEYSKSQDSLTCVPYTDCSSPIYYNKRKNADNTTDYVDDFGRHVYERVNVSPTTGICPTGDKTIGELSADRKCEFSYDLFNCCADDNAVIENKLCVKKNCERCIYETQEQMNRRLASSGGGNIFVSQTVITGSDGTTTPSPSSPDQIIYYKTCDDSYDLYYDTSTSSYPACPKESEPVCPTGYVTESQNNAIICTESTEKVCHKRKDPDDDDNGIHYEIRTFNTTGEDCPSGWKSERFSCPTDYQQILRPQISDDYVYSSTNNSKYYVCCQNSSFGSNISFNDTTNKCELTTCGLNEEPYDNAEGNCRCIKTYQKDTSFNKNDITKYRLQDNNSSSCTPQNANLPPNADKVCKTFNDSEYCCPDDFTSKPYGTDESNFTCTDVWTSNVKPKGFVGFNNEAIVYHKIDYALANDIST